MGWPYCAKMHKGQVVLIARWLVNSYGQDFVMYGAPDGYIGDSI